MHSNWCNSNWFCHSINLAKSTLQQHGIKLPQVPERSSPRLNRTGDIFSGTDRVHASLADSIKLAEDTFHAEGYKERTHNGLKTYWKPKEPQTGDLPSGSKGTNNSDPIYDNESTPLPPDWASGQEFVEYLEELDGPEGFDDLEEWSDDVNMFMEGLSNPHKLEEL